jgi:hypothetical protein
LARRFFAPLTRYHRIIKQPENPFYYDDELFVAGLNTARSFT